MTASRNGFSLGLVLVAAVLALPIGVGSAPAAEQPSAQDIIDALKPPRITRGLTTSPAGAARAAEDARFMDTLRNRPTRSLTTDEREKIGQRSSCGLWCWLGGRAFHSRQRRKLRPAPHMLNPWMDE
jgi:hypothetical protein